jgi:hypothetical protein
MKVYSSCGGLDGSKAIIYRLLKSGLYQDVLQQVVNEEQIIAQPSGSGSGDSSNHQYTAEYQDHYTTCQPKQSLTSLGDDAAAVGDVNGQVNAASDLPVLSQMDDGGFDMYASLEHLDNILGV